MRYILSSRSLSRGRPPLHTASSYAEAAWTARSLTVLKLVKVPQSSRLSSLSPCRRVTGPLPGLPQFCPLGVEAEGRGPPACSHGASRPDERDARLATT